MITFKSIQLTPSDIIQLIGIACTTIASIVAIVISVLNLKQSTKMMEASSRPYIGIYGLSTYIRDRFYYIIIKNLGQSTAHIQSLTYDFDLSKLSRHEGFEPFSRLEGATIVPGQAYRCVIDFDKVTLREISHINFHIVYSSGKHIYDEWLCLKIDANLGNLEAQQNPNKVAKSLEVIAATLQDMHIKSL